MATVIGSIAHDPHDPQFPGNLSETLRAHVSDNTAFAAFHFIHFGLTGMAVEFVDGDGVVLHTSPALPRRKL